MINLGVRLITFSLFQRHSIISLDLISFELWDTESSSIANTRFSSAISIAESYWQVMDSNWFTNDRSNSILNRLNRSNHFKSCHKKVNLQISRVLFVKQLNLQLKLQRPEINQIIFVFSHNRPFMVSWDLITRDRSSRMMVQLMR